MLGTDAFDAAPTTAIAIAGIDVDGPGETAVPAAGASLPPDLAAKARKAERALVKWLPLAQHYLDCLARHENPAPSLIESFRRFFAIGQPLACEFAAAIGVPGNDVGDCAQNVWCDLLTALPRLHYDPRVGKLSSWLYAIVRNEAANLVRHAGPRMGPIGARALAVPALIDPDPLRELEQQVERDLLDQAMVQLRQHVSNDNYQVLYLRLVQGFSVHDTAQAMGKSNEWVRFKIRGRNPFLIFGLGCVTLPPMPRRPRNAAGGLVYHVLNRANRRGRIFHKDRDYEAFETILEAATQRGPGVRVLGWCLMPNHWHLVLWPRKDGDLTAFMRWLTITHTQRHHAHYHTAGQGHLYQGRFKSFAVQEDHHFLMLMRYVHSNPLRAKLVARAEQWAWSTLSGRIERDRRWQEVIAPWPVPRPRNWPQIVNGTQDEAEQRAIRTSITRSRPLGSDDWTARTVARLGLDWTVRPRGRPRKTAAEAAK